MPRQVSRLNGRRDAGAGRTALVATAIATSLASAGCASLAETYGEVSLGGPQVFSREWLLSERSREVSWIEQQLDRPFDPTALQGMRDVRTATAIIASLRASVDLAARRQLGIDRDTQSAERARLEEIRSLEHQIQLAQLQRQLDQVKGSTEALPPSAAVPSDVRSTLEQIGRSLKTINTRLDSLEKGAPPGGSNGLTQLLAAPQGGSTLTFGPSDIERSAARPTAIEQFQDEAAYRRGVNSERLRAELDNVHDLAGSVLYGMRFDVSIAPGDKTRRAAVVELWLKPDEVDLDKLVSEGFMRRFLQVISEESNAIVRRLQQRAEAGRLGEAWRQRVLTGQPRGILLDALEQCQPAGQDPPLRLSDALHADEPPGPRQLAALECAIASYMKHRLDVSQLVARGVLEVTLLPASAPGAPAIDAPTSGGPAPRSWRWADRVRPQLAIAYRRATATEEAPKKRTGDSAGQCSAAQCRLTELLKEIHDPEYGNARAWVATVAPSEYVQNISDVATRNLATQLQLVLGAHGSAEQSVNAQLDQLRVEQERYAAVTRKPLVTGFVRGRQRFGWILGPRLILDDGRADFRQVPAHYDVTASVVVPGWFTRVKLGGCGYWLDASGARTAPFALFGAPSSACRDGPGGTDDRDDSTIAIRLPGEGFRGLMMALADAHLRDVFSSPEIFLRTDAESVSQRVGSGGAAPLLTLRASPATCFVKPDASCEQRLVVEGRELWRNPQVFVGNQRASRVELLPSMQGVQAYFTAVHLPSAAAANRAPAVDLVVSTSAGTDRLRDAVQIVPAQLEAIKPFALPAQPYLEAGDDGRLELDFALAAAAMPASYAEAGVRVRAADAPGPWKELGAPQFHASRAHLTATAQALGLGERSRPVEVDLVMRPRPGDDWVSVVEPAARRIMYVAKREDRALAFAGASSVDLTKSRSFGPKELERLGVALRVEVPRGKASLLQTIYPGLDRALDGRGGAVQLVLRRNAEDDPVVLQARRQAGAAGTYLVPQPAALAEAAGELAPHGEQPYAYSLTVAYRHGSGPWIEIPLAPPATVTIAGPGVAAPAPSAPAAAKP